MIALLLAAQVAVSAPDAAQLADLECRHATGLCTEYYQVVPCPSRREEVRDVRCERDGATQATCTYHLQRRGARIAEFCRARLVRRADGWGYRGTDGSDPALAFLAQNEQGPECGASGSPSPAEVAAVRAAVWDGLACVRFAGECAAYPPRDAAVEKVRCDRYDGKAPYVCGYTLRAAAGVSACKASFRRTDTKWTLTGSASRDGRFSFDESCQPVPR